MLQLCHKAIGMISPLKFALGNFNEFRLVFLCHEIIKYSDGFLES